MNRKLFFSASLMCGRLLKLEEDINVLSASKLIDYVHVDISDGIFSNNIILGYDTTNLLASYPVPLDIHLMMNYPSRAIGQLQLRQSDIVSIHVECQENLSDVISKIRTIGCKVGLFIKLNTPLEDIFPYIGEIDFAYLMMSPIGYSANVCNSKMVSNLMDRAQLLQEAKPDLIIGADGGIKFEYIEDMYRSGVRLFVLGKNSLFQTNIENGLANLSNITKIITN